MAQKIQGAKIRFLRDLPQPPSRREEGASSLFGGIKERDVFCFQISF